MPLKVEKTNIDVNKAMDILVAQLTPRLEAVGERIAQKAREKAPVGHGERQGKAEPIRVRQSGRGLSALQGRQLKEILGGEPAEVVFRKALANRGKSKSVLEVQHEFAQLFRFQKGGGTPERVELRGRGDKLLRGFRRTKPHLRDTIRSEGVTREGDVLHLTVAARSDHAYQVEKGFHHKGGTQVAGHPYLYPALDSERDGLADGSSLKG